MPLPFWRAGQPSWSTMMREPRRREATGGRADAWTARSARRRPRARRSARTRSSATAAGRRATPQLDPGRPARPCRRRVGGRRAAARSAADERRRVVGRDGHPAARLRSTIRRHLGAGVDGGDARAAGGEDRVRLRRHARRAPARAQRHGVDVAGRQHLGQPAVGQRSRRSARWRARRRLASRSGRAAPSPLIRNVDVGQAPGGVEQQVRATARTRRCRRTCTTGSAPIAELAPVRRHPVAGRMRVGVDEVRDHAHRVGGAGRRPWPATLAREVVGQHGDGVGAAVADPLEPRATAMTPRFGDGAGLDGGIGEHVLDVEHERRPARAMATTGR